MYAKPNALAAYSRIAGAETDPIKQIVMLYDGAIKFLNLSAGDIEAGDFIAKGEHSNRALDIVGYLQSILDFEKGGNVAANLDNLYRSVTALILKASAAPDPGTMRRAARLLTPVRDAWAANAQTSVPARAPGLYGTSAAA
jgi:flagellar secretion chaperone FliS